ncbi:hypothetical protein BVY02_02460, partial [bacterium J17]
IYTGGGYGRDELVYNLEFTNIHFLQNSAFAYLQPDKHIPIFSYKRHAGFGNPGLINAKTFQRTIDPFDGYGLRYRHSRGLFAGRSEGMFDEFIYLGFANFPYQGELKKLLDMFPLLDSKTISRNGYTLGVYRFRNANKAPPPVGAFR